MGDGEVTLERRFEKTWMSARLVSPARLSPLGETVAAGDGLTLVGIGIVVIAGLEVVGVARDRGVDFGVGQTLLGDAVATDDDVLPSGLRRVAVFLRLALAAEFNLSADAVRLAVLGFVQAKDLEKVVGGVATECALFDAVSNEDDVCALAAAVFGGGATALPTLATLMAILTALLISPAGQAVANSCASRPGALVCAAVVVIFHVALAPVALGSVTWIRGKDSMNSLMSFDLSQTCRISISKPSVTCSPSPTTPRGRTVILNVCSPGLTEPIALANLHINEWQKSTERSVDALCASLPKSGKWTWFVFLNDSPETTVAHGLLPSGGPDLRDFLIKSTMLSS